MNPANDLSWQRRFAFYALAWIVAGMLIATFCDGTVEAGNSELAELLGIFGLTPFIMALGMAVTFTGSYDVPMATRGLHDLFWFIIFMFYLLSKALLRSV